MTTLTSPSTEQLREQVELILHSPVFASSEILRKLLAFLSAHAIEGRSETLKVREIAVAVFGRSEDFDSQTDSVVRVHTGRLRSKLAEYYMADGEDADVVIAIPKGGYAITCHFRHVTAARGGEAVSTELMEPATLPVVPLPGVALPIEPAQPTSAARGAIPLRTFLLCLIAVGFGAWGLSAYLQQRTERNRVPAAVRTFWQGFAAPGERSLLVFSNFRFLASAAGLATYDGPDDPQKQIIDTYTTMGEVMGVYQVSRTLELLGQQLEVKRSRLLTWDEAKDRNLIFVGGPLADTPLRDVTLLRDFEFKDTIQGQRSVGALFNKSPRTGERPVYFASDSVYVHADVHTSKVDYAVIALRPSFNGGRQTLVLAGISEYGTQGASDFVTNESSVKDLLTRLGVRNGEHMPAFEALLRVRVEGGVPVASELVSLHPHSE